MVVFHLSLHAFKISSHIKMKQSVVSLHVVLTPVVFLRFGDGYMITVRTKTGSNVKEVVRFFNRNFPEAVLKVDY